MSSQRHDETRVLFLSSINDELTARRMHILKESPRLANLTIDGFCLVRLTEADKKSAHDEFAPSFEPEVDAWESRDTPLDAKELFNALSAKCEEFRPDLILVHTGFAFQANFDVCVDVLRNIKNRFQVKLGVERLRFPELEDDPLFDSDEQTREIVALITDVRHGPPRRLNHDHS